VLYGRSSIPRKCRPLAPGALRAQILAVLSCTLLLACSPPGDDAPPAEASQVKVRVMAFNIEWGGTHVSFEKVSEAIRRADPDIVAIQEAEGNLERLAAELGWHYDLRNHVVAPHRLIDPPGAGGRYILAELDPGLVVAVANVHLPSDPYGEDWIRDGHTVDEVSALEGRVRLPSIQPFLEVLPQLAQDGIPVFLAGDFNSPSHEDWGPEAISRWPFRRYPVGWPVAEAIHAAGFRDSYRQRHSDPLDHPGFTWWADRPEIPDYNPGPPDSWQSRIDFIWYAGPAEVTQSTLVGESGASGVSIAVTPWPSDHRAVLSDFVAEAAPMPFLVAANRRLFRSGELVSVVYCNRTPSGALIIAPVNAGNGRGAVSRRFAVSAERGVLRLNEALPATGRYRVVLEDSQRRTISRNDFWVLPTDARPAIETGSDGYAQGESLSVIWRNAPGNRYDWIAIYSEDIADRDAYVAWAHVDARIEGETTLDAAHAVAEWPLPPGRYVASLMTDDGFELLAQSAPFEIRAAAAPGR
jgi:endonuclease/exonuclease/phosphatase family metal-dependent hydrolase